MGLGKRLRDERERQEMSRTALAQRSGTSVSAILRTEVHGHHPRIPTLRAWAEVLGVSLTDLLGEEAAA